MIARRRIAGALLACAAALAGATRAQEQPSRPAPAPDPLFEGFRDPPNSARPRVWWHWMNGNVTKDGIGRDLAWMKRIGIGGMQNFDAALGTPQVVDRRLIYMTPEWREAFRHAATLAADYDLELGIAASPGWSETGGPWVPPADGMKKLVWTEVEVAGGRRFVGAVPAPGAITGPYRDMPAGSMLASAAHAPSPEAYGDVALVAYRLPDRAAAGSSRITASGRALDAALLTDGHYAAAVEVPRAVPGGEAQVLVRYPRATAVRSATVSLKPAGRSAFTPSALLPVLEARDRGGAWRKLADLPLIADVPTTVSFAPVTARAFRVRFLPQRVQATAERLNAAPGAITDTYRPTPPPATTVSLSELHLSPEARVDRFEAKAGFAVARDYNALERGRPADARGLARDGIVDLTARMAADGRLDWTPPPGRWRLVRLGWSLTGTRNHPATPEATGLEVDKLDGAAVERYMTTYLDRFRDTVGPDLMGARGLRAMVTDSFEAGAANWTPGLPRHFLRLRGYDLRPYLPALTGAVVGSRAETDRFLYDYRRTLAELLASEHYGTIARIARRYGLTLYGEALEVARPALGDDMAMRRHADVPMAAMWTFRPEAGPRSTFVADIRGAASVAHVYGQNLVAAESLTSGLNYWAHAPADLKRAIDTEFALGVNRPVIHTSVHQPLERKPGFSLLVFGQFFNRHETWAEMARPWIDYIARSSFLLQQGRYHADLAYFHGEEGPLTALYNDAQPKDAPARYGFDFVNADVILNDMRIVDGALVTSGGARYRAIYLGGSSRRMTLPVLRRLAELVRGGATLIGQAPVDSPALRDDPAVFARLTGELWGGGGETSVGRGRVIASSDPDAALERSGLAPDVEILDAPQRDVMALHRRLDDGDIYFLSNRGPAGTVRVRLRASGRRPELWRADTGSRAPVSYRIDGGRTTVTLDLAADDAVFLVLREPARQASLAVRPEEWAAPVPVAGSWRLAFESDRGAPAEARADALRSLTDFAEPGIRYYSGVTRYAIDVATPPGYRAGAPLLLDLGKVGDVAEVRLNGRPVGTLWKPPYRIDIGGAARPGSNRLEVRVANLWMNRLIGDAQPGAARIGFTTLPTYRADAPLRASGLIGPVTLARGR